MQKKRFNALHTKFYKHLQSFRISCLPLSYEKGLFVILVRCEYSEQKKEVLFMTNM